MRRGLKRVYIRIEKDGKVVLRSAPIRTADAERIIASKAAWIFQKKSEISARPIENTENSIKYLGKSYKKVIVRDDNLPMGRIMLDFVGDDAVFRFNPHMRDAQTEDFYEKFIKKEAHRLILPLIEKWAEITGLKPLKISFRRQKSRWGSCSGRGSISLNINLVSLPLRTIEYVIVHELCHLKHHNHSKAFWEEVEKFLPDYRTLRDKLRT